MIGYGTLGFTSVFYLSLSYCSGRSLRVTVVGGALVFYWLLGYGSRRRLGCCNWE